MAGLHSHCPAARILPPVTFLAPLILMSQDRKTRTKGERVIHTVKGTPYHGDRYEAPRGLTTEQSEDQRRGAKLDERQTRESRRLPTTAKAKSDEVTTARASVSRRSRSR